MLKFKHFDVRKAILKSQHCQRNFDLTQNFPEKDLEIFKKAISQALYSDSDSFKVHFVFDRKIIKKIHETTKGFLVKSSDSAEPLYQTNSQVLANLLVVFESIEPNKNQNVNIGIAAGQLNLTASLLGYHTGCCSCFRSGDIQKFLNLKNQPLLLMGVGFKDYSRNRREHHLDKDFIFPSIKKQEIQIHTLGKPA